MTLTTTEDPEIAADASSFLLCYHPFNLQKLARNSKLAGCDGAHMWPADGTIRQTCNWVEKKNLVGVFISAWGHFSVASCFYDDLRFMSQLYKNVSCTHHRSRSAVLAPLSTPYFSLNSFQMRCLDVVSCLLRNHFKMVAWTARAFYATDSFSSAVTAAGNIAHIKKDKYYNKRCIYI